MFDVKQSAEPIGVTVPPRRVETLLEHAVWYAEERHWDVLPGTWIEFYEGVPYCSCAMPGCEAPGAHPAGRGWEARATGVGAAARRLWSADPQASVLLPTGRAFDIVEVPEAEGHLALTRMERMGITLGPVSCSPLGRLLFFVLPGGAAKTPAVLRQLGLPPDAVDLVARGEGDVVPAPPTRIVGRGPVQWVRRPTAAHRWLPDAEELLPTLAYACRTQNR